MPNPPYWAIPRPSSKKPQQARAPVPDEPEEEYAQQPPLTEEDLPDFLKRGRQFAPKSPPLSHRQIPPAMQKQADRIDSYYQNTPEPVQPAPKRRRFSPNTILAAVFMIICFAGLACALTIFTYARGVSNMATSLSFIHAEMGLLFITQALMFLYFLWKRDGI